MKKNRVTAIAAAALAALALSTVSRASATITANTSSLSAGTAGQVVMLNIVGNDQIAGEDLRIQINDGTFGPLMTNVDILTGTIFSGGSIGSSAGLITTGQFANRIANFSATTGSGSVSDTGLLAKITINTVGFAGTSFSLNLFGTQDGDTSLIVQQPSPLLVTPSFPGNTFTVAVPEPASLGFLTAAALLLFRRSRAK
jgi:hypothetical protein